MEHPDLRRLQSRSPSAAADVVSAVFDPLVLIAAVLWVVSVDATGSLWAGSRWAAIAIACCAGIPELAVRFLVRSGRAGQRQLPVREERRLPLLVALAAVVLAVLILRAAGAPRDLLAVVLTVLAGLVVLSTLTAWWKASFHAYAATATAVVLAVHFDARWGLAALPVIAAVGWARVRSGRHSVAQVAAGIILGLLVTGTIYPLLR